MLFLGPYLKGGSRALLHQRNTSGELPYIHLQHMPLYGHTMASIGFRLFFPGYLFMKKHYTFLYMVKKQKNNYV